MGFTANRSVVTNELSLLKLIYEALDNEKTSEVTVFFSEFSKGFDKVPHKELLKKVSNLGVGGCIPENLVDYLDGRKQFVRADNTNSKILGVTGGVPHKSLPKPLPFCIFNND